MNQSHLGFEVESLIKENPSKKIGETDTYTLFSRKYNLYPEGYFRGMLIMERKRTERSGDPFMLMLLDIKKIVKRKTFRLCRKNKTIKKIVEMLRNSTREIDLKVWFKQNREIGIIFTELNGVKKESLITKIKDNLYSILDTNQAAKVEISCFSFPEKNKKKECINSDINKALYKELTMKNPAKKVSISSKRIIDVIGSTIGIILFSPFLIVISVMIKLSSKGPVLFKQKRVGRYGREFTFLKFRSMHVNNDHEIHKNFMKQFICSQGNGQNTGNKIYKMKDDPRITKIGNFLRKSSLDELPQFLNVLLGQMSLVGPRPAIPYEVEEYDTWHKRRVLEVKPGITGVWQVDGRSNTPFEKMVRMDINYIINWSLLLDIKLLFKTPLAVFAAKGAY